MTDNVSLTSSPQYEEYAQTLGAIVSVMLQNNFHRNLSVASLAVWIEPALILRQAKIFYSKNGTAVGYICWAKVGDASSAKLAANSNHILHISEWNEGDNLWIMDFCCIQGRTASISSYIRDNMFLGSERINYYRGDKEGRLRSYHWRVG